VGELAGLLFARGIRGIRADPGVTPEHILALFGVAMGKVPPDDSSLGHLTLTIGRRSQRLSRATPTPARGTPAIDLGGPRPAASPPSSQQSAPVRQEGTVRRVSTEFQPDTLPVDIAARRAIANLTVEATPEARREAVATIQALTPRVLALRDVGVVAEAVAALDRVLVTVDDPALAEAIETAAGALAD
jgi:hypothetical protein